MPTLRVKEFRSRKKRLKAPFLRPAEWGRPVNRLIWPTAIG